MGIKTIQASEVSCQKCEATILVKHWTDAKTHGWVVPCDGHLQLCPFCAAFQKGVLFATAEALDAKTEKE